MKVSHGDLFVAWLIVTMVLPPLGLAIFGLAVLAALLGFVVLLTILAIRLLFGYI